jgi:NADH-quinone oxidoreductase subunit J
LDRLHADARLGAAAIINRNSVASAQPGRFLSASPRSSYRRCVFIGTFIQVLVCAGAVIVLFLFIIMRLDLRAEERRRINLVTFAGGATVAVIFFGQLYLVVGQLHQAKLPFAALPPMQVDDVHSIGLLLFGNYNLPLQIIGVLILVATIGVIVLSKRELH